MTKLLNRILALALVLALTVPSLTAFASEGSPATTPPPSTPLGVSGPASFSLYAVNDEFEDGGIKYKVLTEDGVNNTVAVIANDYSGDVIIPTTVTNGAVTYSVTSIGDYAFSRCKNLTSVTIPNSVTSIGYREFMGCDNLATVTIGSGVTTIGIQAFVICPNLTSISVDTGNQHYTSVDGVVFNAEKTILLIYPMGKKANTYTIPDSVTTIGHLSFFDSINLTSIKIPNSVTRIESESFSESRNLTTISIPNSVTSIDHSAFSGCTSLATITISESVTRIGNRTFKGCRSLTEITIPESVTRIGFYAFADCSSLEKVTFLGTVPPTIESDSFEHSPITQVLVPAGSEAAYSAIADRFPVGVVFEEGYKVTFNPNGGALVSGDLSQLVVSGGSAVAPVLTKAGYTFAGWDKQFDNITSDVTITAQWKTAQTGSSSSGGSGTSKADVAPTAGTATTGKPLTKTDATKLFTTALAAKPEGGTTLSIKVRNVTKVDKTVLAELAALAQKNGVTLTVHFDTAVGGKVVSRISINPAAVTTSLDLTVKIVGNKITMPNLTTPVELAVKMPAGMTIETLKITGDGMDITASAKPWLDKNGYLHFTTTGGEIVLTKK